jgi:hypothetical protein
LVSADRPQAPRLGGNYPALVHDAAPLPKLMLNAD